MALLTATKNTFHGSRQIVDLEGLVLVRRSWCGMTYLINSCAAPHGFHSALVLPLEIQSATPVPKADL
jgi:hypothetical protein